MAVKRNDSPEDSDDQFEIMSENFSQSAASFNNNGSHKNPFDLNLEQSVGFSEHSLLSKGNISHYRHCKMESLKIEYNSYLRKNHPIFTVRC